MEEALKALGPWPMAQGIAIGLIIAALGGWAFQRGLRDRNRDREPSLEEAKAKWELYGQIRHIHQNSFEMVKHAEKSNELLAGVLAALNRFNDNRWNKTQ